MLSDLTADLANDNPLGYDAEDLQSIYAYKLKHLLTSAALGMMPSKTWTGHYDANGGYLVVKKDGEILCYHSTTITVLKISYFAMPTLNVLRLVATATVLSIAKMMEMYISNSIFK